MHPSIAVICCIAFFAMACSAQKQAAKPDDWAINNAMIGPDSPIEIAAGIFLSGTRNVSRAGRSAVSAEGKRHLVY